MGGSRCFCGAGSPKPLTFRPCDRASTTPPERGFAARGVRFATKRPDDDDDDDDDVCCVSCGAQSKIRTMMLTSAIAETTMALRFALHKTRIRLAKRSNITAVSSNMI